MELSLRDKQIKELLKAALIEVLTERQDLLSAAIREAIDDYAREKATGETPAGTPPTPIQWLEQLAASSAFAEMEDPVEWQRSIRQDRPLPR